MNPSDAEALASELVERLAAVDPADAPEIADRVAEHVSAALDPDGTPDEEPA